MSYLSRRLQRRPLLIALAAVAWALATAATPADQGEHRHGAQHQHGAHVHGSGRLNLVLEGDSLYIELDSPAANLLGFEHAPASAADRARLERTVAALEDGDRLFRFDEAAACRQAEVGITSALLGGAADRSGQDRADHADILVNYRFHCQRPGRLQRLEVGLFDGFPATERLRLQFIVGGRQGAALLTAGDPVAHF